MGNSTAQTYGFQMNGTASNYTLTANFAPTVTPFSVSTLVNSTYNFTATDFSSRYSDLEGTAFSGITITSLPATGTLRLGPGNVSANQFISAADLGRLNYVAPATAGTASFNFTVSDGTSTSGSTTVTIDTLVAQVAFRTVGSTNWTVPANVTRVDVLVVGGGGGGGSFGGGGGAGGLIYTNNLQVAPGASIPVTVGAGGAGGVYGTWLRGSNGSNSIFNTLTALGGGGGGSRNDGTVLVYTNQVGAAGGCGGGGAQNNANVAGMAEGGASLQTNGFGNAGGRGKYANSGVPDHGGGGGGGAGWPGRAVVENQGGWGGIGGDGLYIPQFITLGDNGWFAGGGGGIVYANGYQANYGGRGGGGRGGWSSATAFDGSAGTANTGGGGGSGRYQVSGFAGGSGIVVVDYSPRVSAILPTDGFYHTTGTASDAKGVNVIAYNLMGNITVYAPTGYEVSATSGGSYASTLTLTPSSGVVSTTFYVRIAAGTISANPTGTVTLSTSGLANTSVDLNAFRLVFTNVGTNNFTMPSHVSKVDLLVVGGGAGASGHRSDNGGPAVSARTGGSGGGASGAGANRAGGAAAAGTAG
ncbi:MAG: hypothetical protein EBT68_07290, partial [Verrucomicrobia bacterium]|nr:hypothetical protein [Verrucomicrobiota bacterium]